MSRTSMVEATETLREIRVCRTREFRYWLALTMCAFALEASVAFEMVFEGVVLRDSREWALILAVSTILFSAQNISGWRYYDRQARFLSDLWGVVGEP